MKKILISLFVFMIAGACFGYPKASDDRATFRNGYAWTGHPSRDKATQWAKGIEGEATGLGTGKIWYVDVDATSPGAGTSWEKAAASLDAIFTIISADGGAGRGDVVMIAENSDETFTASNTITLNVAGVRIVGKGQGGSRPTFTFATNASRTLNSIHVTAANNSFENCRFTSSVTGLDSVFDVTAAYFSLIGCEFFATSQSTPMASVTTWIYADENADNLLVANCYQDNTTEEFAQATTSSFITFSPTHSSQGPVNCRVIGNVSIGNFDYGNLELFRAYSSPLNLLIKDNIFVNSSTYAESNITFSTSFTTADPDEQGSNSATIICNNYLRISGTLLVADGGKWINIGDDSDTATMEPVIAFGNYVNNSQATISNAYIQASAANGAGIW